MRMTDLIEKKRDGGELTGDEIRWMIRGFTDGVIPDYQMSAMCMAIIFRRMNDRETYDLTMAMVDSGETIDLSRIDGVTADKHSTGGVGDKTSLVLCPMLAACGVKMAKLSGRGLGHTGGTIDKLESFPGFSSSMSTETFTARVNEIGFAIAGQTGTLVPADKKLYALRDVTGTVPSRALIVSSIMSKKLAAGADIIVLDVKTGSGAFMDTETRAFGLARAMTEVGHRCGKRVVAVVSDMDEPLGHAVGNALEVREALAALRGEYEGDLTELCLCLGSQVLLESGLAGNEPSARVMLRDTITNGTALACFRRFIEAQGGDAAAVDDPTLLPAAPVVTDVPSERGGYVSRLDAHGVGEISMHLGGGRVEKDDMVDLSVGIVLHRKIGDPVHSGESLGTIHAASPEAAASAAELLKSCFAFSDTPIQRAPFIKGIVR